MFLAHETLRGPLELIDQIKERCRIYLRILSSGQGLRKVQIVQIYEN
jgi:hypothetical protein